MKRVVLSEHQITAACGYLGANLSAELKNEAKTPVFLCVMRGGLPFMADLIKQLDIDILWDYIQISSYESFEGTPIVSLAKDVSIDLSERTVVIVEDVVDTGLTVRFLLEHLKKNFNPKRVLVCTLIDKIKARRYEVPIDYYGLRFEENEFLLGYGLDYKGLMRNTPYVYVPDEEERAKWDNELLLKKKAG